MALETINNGDLGPEIRAKLNGNFAVAKSDYARISFDELYTNQSNFSDQTINIQDGLFYAQRLYREIRGGSSGLDDQFVKNDGVTFIVPKRFAITSPIYVPENVKLELPSGLILGTLGGSPSASYAGDPTTGTALINVHQPMLILPAGSSCGDVGLYAKNGTQSVSGLCYGKNWTVASVSVANGGSGYTVNDVVYLPQPSKAPYQAASATVTSVNGSGAVTGLTMLSEGAYSVPPGGQSRYWTGANGYSGAIANGVVGTVFASAGVYITRGGTGTGLTLSASWTPDFAGDGSDYNTGASLQGDGQLGNIRVYHAGESNDVTYGKQFGAYFALGLYCATGNVATQGGYYGVLSKMTDFHPAALLPVQAPILLKFDSCSSVNCEKVVLDTWDVAPLEIDACSGVRLIGRAFQGPLPITNELATQGVRIGQNKTTPNRNLNIDMRISGGGYLPGSEVIGAKIANVAASVLNIESANTDSSYAVVGTPIAILIETGANVKKNNVITGFADYGVTRTIKPLAGQVLPNCLISIREARRQSVISGNTRINQNLLKSPRAVWNSSAWVASGGVAVNDPSINSPTGKRDVTKITWSGSNQYIRQQFNCSGSDEVNASFWIKAGTISQIYLTVGDGSGTNYGRIIAVPSATGGTISSPGTLGSGVLLSYEVKDYGNGWQKFTIVGTFGLGSPYLQIASVSGSTSGYFYLWGTEVLLNPINAQTDQGPLEGAPITATVGTSATAIAYAQMDGELLTVSGYTGSTFFSDLIMTFVGRAPAVVYSDAGSGSPASRTYSYASGAIQLAMGAGSYSVITTSALPM